MPVKLMGLLTDPVTRPAKPVAPLTHHEILSLIAPFTRCGHEVDLAASDRLNRILRFKPVMYGGAWQRGDISDQLQLSCFPRGQHVLIRTLTLASGLSATLEAAGNDSAELLARIGSLDPSGSFRCVGGRTLALSHRLIDSEGTAGFTREFVRGETTLAGLKLMLQGPRVQGYPVDVELSPLRPVALPEDLLAVLGRMWSPLRQSGAGWRGTLTLRGRDADLGALIERQIERAVLHLSHTLAQPPADYHAQWMWPRWCAMLHRALPLLCFGIPITVAAVVALIGSPANSVLHLLPAAGIPLFAIGTFLMRDPPSLEIPPLPRPLHCDAWQPMADGQPT